MSGDVFNNTNNILIILEILVFLYFSLLNMSKLAANV